MTSATRPALLVVDVQQGLDDPKYGARNNPDAERHIAALLDAWRSRDMPVVHVQHMSTRPDSPLRPGLPGNAIKPDVAPRDGEPLFQKTVNSAFVGTGLAEWLRAREIEHVVVTGLTTNHCVATTARMAANLGFVVTVVDDATATNEATGPDGTRYSAEVMHGVEMAALHGEFATVRKTRELLDDLNG